MLYKIILLLICNLIFIQFTTGTFHKDKTCNERPIFNRSVICVCTSTYCDEITREPIPRGSYISYTSSNAGSRFMKAKSYFRPWVNRGPEAESKSITLELDTTTTYQTIHGFGGAVTDAVGINWKKLGNPELMQRLVDSYYGCKGLEYNMMRIPIGGCDFSTHAYTYNEFPENDVALSNFSLAYEDYEYKLPLIKAAMNVSTDQINIVASLWSPPVWMKSNHQIGGANRLKPEHFGTLADYFMRFIEEYSKEGVPTWAVTTTNEPLNGIMSLVRFNDLGWIVSDMGKFIHENLGPKVRNCESTRHVKILAVDDQRYLIPLWFNMILWEYPDALKYIDGVAVHFYADMVTPASMLTETMIDYPDVFVIATEACAGALPWEKRGVDLGAWDRAEYYTRDIMEDLNNNLTGWIDWNIALDAQGGPNWVHNYVDAPIIVFPERGEFIKQPMFYAMGHFSKFIPRGSVRIKVTKTCDSTTPDYIAFLTPRKTVVVVLMNKKKESTVVTLKIGFRQADVLVQPRSIVTVEFNHEI